MLAFADSYYCCYFLQDTLDCSISGRNKHLTHFPDFANVVSVNNTGPANPMMGTVVSRAQFECDSPCVHVLIRISSWRVRRLHSYLAA